VLYSPHELRVESRTAIPQLALWLQQALGVDFRFSETVTQVATPRVTTSRGSYHAERVVVCNNADPGGLFAANGRSTRCSCASCRCCACSRKPASS
jgi:glycine/D-amino acid oxidase-like deaminating enzyme